MGCGVAAVPLEKKSSYARRRDRVKRTRAAISLQPGLWAAADPPVPGSGVAGTVVNGLPGRRWRPTRLSSTAPVPSQGDVVYFGTNWSLKWWHLLTAPGLKPLRHQLLVLRPCKSLIWRQSVKAPCVVSVFPRYLWTWSSTCTLQRPSECA